VKLAHVRERHAPAGASWRLAAAVDQGDAPNRWLDLDVARRRVAAADSGLAHNDPVFRRPISTLDEHLAAGLRIEALGAIVDRFTARSDDDAVLQTADLAFGSPILRPPSLRDFYAFERHVGTMWARRGGEIPEAWFRLPIFYFSNVSEIRGPGDPVWAPNASEELDYELEVAALVDTPARDLGPDRADEVIGGFMIMNDWSARDLQREETTVRLGPAKGKDFATTLGPWLVTLDELRDRRSGNGFALEMTATVNGSETSRGSWASVHFSFGQMLERASADVQLRAGDVLGSGTVGGGSLLEIREETLGRYLEPGDEVVLRIERLGELRSPVVARPGGTA
jgi:fumarylacetoacetate (FAA) hydrolase